MPGKDDITGEPLIQRSDDNEATLRKRLTVYHTQTSPLVQFYRSRGQYAQVNAAQSMEQVHKQIETAIALKMQFKEMFDKD